MNEFGMLLEILDLPESATIPTYVLSDKNELTLTGLYYNGIIVRPEQLGSIAFELDKGEVQVQLAIRYSGEEYVCATVGKDELELLQSAFNHIGNKSPYMIIVNQASLYQLDLNGNRHIGYKPLVLKTSMVADNYKEFTHTKLIHCTPMIEFIDHNVRFFGASEIPRSKQGDPVPTVYANSRKVGHPQCID